MKSHPISSYAVLKSHLTLSESKREKIMQGLCLGQTNHTQILLLINFRSRLGLVVPSSGIASKKNTPIVGYSVPVFLLLSRRRNYDSDNGIVFQSPINSCQPSHCIPVYDQEELGPLTIASRQNTTRYPASCQFHQNVIGLSVKMMINLSIHYSKKTL